MSKEALQKIESHEKLCRIMQKQTHDKIHNLRKSSKQNRKNNVDFSRCINYRYGISHNCINYTMKLNKKYPYKHYNRFSDTTGRKYLVDNIKVPICNNYFKRN